MIRPIFRLPVLIIGVALMLSGGLRAQDAKQPPRTGKFRGDLIDPVKSDIMMRVALQAPENVPAQKHLGLLFLFHGYQGNEGNYIGLTVAALKRLNLGEQYVVISGKSKGPGWTTEDDERVLRVVGWAKQHYPIDSRRIFIFGSSNGAAFVGRFGSEHQELVAGVVGYCGAYKFAKAIKVEEPARTRNEWYFVHGSKDNPQNSRRACAELKSHGYRYVFRQMDGYGHTDIWDSRGHPDSQAADAVRDDWLLWLHALRHKEIAPADDEQKSLASVDDKLKAGTVEEPDKAFAETARIGGPPAAKVILEAFASGDAKVRAAAALTAERTAYGVDVVDRLAALLEDKTAAVRHAALKALGAAANWRYAQAQTALARLARNKDATLADRVQAVEALGKAARLALLGNFEDAAIIWALVLSLDDEQQPIRAAAFAALEKDVSDTFAYKPELADAERKAPLAKWHAWCTEKCGPIPEGLR